MQIPFARSAHMKRRAELRSVLNTGRVVRRSKRQLIQQYVADNYKGLLAGLFVAACAAVHIYYFNVLTVMRQQIGNLHAQIDNSLQMRQNTVPSLTVAVNRFISYEKNLFLTTAESREKSLNASKDMDELLGSLKDMTGSGQLPGNLPKLMAVAENYPQLVSIQSYKSLIDQISNVEKEIYLKRVEYNQAVNIYNTTLGRFPANAAGRLMGFFPESYMSWNEKAEWKFVPDADSGQTALKVESEQVVVRDAE